MPTPASLRDRASLVERDVSVSLSPTPTQAVGAEDLITWTIDTALSVFPNHTNWEANYDTAYDTSLKATFGLPGQTNYGVEYNYTTWKQLYTAIYQEISTDLASAQIEIVDAVAYTFPDDPLGGYVYLTGLEYGFYKNGTQTQAARDGLFAVVKTFNGVRKIVEWRESSNFHG
jgi:hypothetical protein